MLLLFFIRRNMCMIQTPALYSVWLRCIQGNVFMLMLMVLASDFYWLWTGPLFSGLTSSCFDASWRTYLWSTVFAPSPFSFRLRWIVLFGLGSWNRLHLRKHTGRSTSIIPITTILHAPKELSHIQQTACKVLKVRDYFRQGWYRFSPIISRDS